MTSTKKSEDSWRNAAPWTKARYRWLLSARPNQVDPGGDWATWLLLAGRGFGKTRCGAEAVSDHCRQHSDARVALVGPTIADVRDTMIEGESGMLACVPAQALRGGTPGSAWNRSTMELHFANGAQCKGFAGETPDRLRGPQHDYAWVDELAAFRYPQETWDMLMFGLRLGDQPRVVVTTTPRPTRIIRDLIAAPTTHITKGSTYDNLDNLAPTFAAQILARYEGTRLGRQELHAELLEDAEGALWTSAMFEAEGFRLAERPPLRRVVIGVDPSGTRDGDACGIVAAGVDHNGKLIVLEDVTIQASPDEWARAVVACYDRNAADRVVVEANFGGELAETVLHTVRRGLPVRNVHASRGKQQRAEPVAAVYEQGRAHHVGALAALETELTSWEPSSDWSPNRVDALVWAATDLVLGSSEPAVSATAARVRLVRTPMSRYA